MVYNNETAQVSDALLVNMFVTPDNHVLHSRHTHDYVSHVDNVTREYYFIDGGCDYIRMSVNLVPMRNACLYEHDKIEHIRQFVTRGTFDAHGNRVFVPLCAMSNAHVERCIGYNTERGESNTPITNVYRRELQYRREHDIVINEREYTQNDTKIDYTYALQHHW